MREKILVLDFGSQYAHLIAKRFRMLGFYSEIALPDSSTNVLEGVKGIVLSGSPYSLHDTNAPKCNKALLEACIPILGLCYGHYVVQDFYGGKVGKAEVGEFGHAMLSIDTSVDCPLFKGLDSEQQVWMSHEDAVLEMAEGFVSCGKTADCFYAATQDLNRKRFSLQFHCEVNDTPCGNTIFLNYANYCGMRQNWDSTTVLNTILTNIKGAATDKKVLLFLSGGVDSTVTFALLNKALGKGRVLGLHIDNGFMRKDESHNIELAYRQAGYDNFIIQDASASFIQAVSNMTDPQKKRIAIGETFIKVRDDVVKALHLNDEEWLLAQGTLYPDIIESGGTQNSNTIKTHHNRVEGIQKLIAQHKVIEPISQLYKDEVRNIGKALGLDNKLVMRHPFPGPGLSINVLCSTGKLFPSDIIDMNKALKELNTVNITQFCQKCSENLTRSVLPVRSVGVQGDFRTYRFASVLTFAKQDNGFYHLPKNWDKIEAASSNITNHTTLINRMIIKLWQNQNIADSSMILQENYCTKERLDMLREVDNIVLNYLHDSGYYNKIFQHLTISLPFASRKDHNSFVLRPLVSEDVMTASFARLPPDLLLEITKKIASLPFVDAIYYDCTNKPPATFGWE